jgi:hypothetical protein
MTTKSEPLTLDDVYAYLMAYETHQLKHQSELQAGHGSSTNYVGRGGASRGRGHGDRGKGRSILTGGFSPCPTDHRGDRRPSSHPP